MRKALLIPYTFMLMNWASVAGLYYFVRGKDAGKDLWLKHQPYQPAERKAA